jgi:hypothetical protein
MAKTRSQSVDLLFRICDSYHVSSETVCASTVILDRFFAAASNASTHDPCYAAIEELVQNPYLVAVACFLVTCKFREILCPLLQDLEQLTGTRCSTEEIRAAEVTMLAAIDWDLHCVTGELLACAPARPSCPLLRHFWWMITFLVPSHKRLGARSTLYG